MSRGVWFWGSLGLGGIWVFTTKYKFGSNLSAEQMNGLWINLQT